MQPNDASRKNKSARLQLLERQKMMIEGELKPQLEQPRLLQELVVVACPEVPAPTRLRQPQRPPPPTLVC